MSFKFRNVSEQIRNTFLENCSEKIPANGLKIKWNYGAFGEIILGKRYALCNKVNENLLCGRLFSL